MCGTDAGGNACGTEKGEGPGLREAGALVALGLRIHGFLLSVVLLSIDLVWPLLRVVAAALLQRAPVRTGGTSDLLW
ncbi:MAG: hypothetical protein QOJ50_467 [Cryptosporangiaceae bacterium]|jgi:hypothetical protein|nr:hypothetical protein [Cryptosporangiaceae bacterium]